MKLIVQHTPLAIINRKDLCNCVIQTTEIQLIGSHTNDSSNGNFLIQHTFNFGTEHKHNKMTMSYYREDAHILLYIVKPKSKISVFLKPSEPMLTQKAKLPAISLHKLDALVNRLQYHDIYPMKAERKRKDNRLLNQSLTDNMDDTDDILEIDSWFNDEIQSSIIFIFISCIIAIIAFLLLLISYELFV